MTIHVALHHRTSYRFDRPVLLFPHVVRLRPAPHCRTPVLAYTLQVDPEPLYQNWQQDAFGNYLVRLQWDAPAEHLELRVDLHADLTAINPFEFFLDDSAQTSPFTYEPRVARDLAPYLEIATDAPAVERWIAALPPLPENTVDRLVAVNRAVYDAVAYTIRMEPGVQTPDQTLALAVGSCRDSAWLLAEVLRRMGLAARFVSGYLVQLRAVEPPVDGPAGPEADFTDLHAWTEVFVPGAGWIGLDPTSGLLAGEGHIPLACTPGTDSAAPITGATGPCEVEFDFANAVTRIREDARVTRPLTEAGWARVQAVGNRVDADLAAGDVRLTMGGEPTFVATGAMDEAEWNTAADGARKRELATTLFRSLAERFAPGGAWFFGQGKWYPGEPLPRWQKTVWFRSDGEPLWRDRRWLAAPDDAALLRPAAQRPAPDRGGARALADAGARELGVAADLWHGAHEDLFHAAWRAGDLALPEANGVPGGDGVPGVDGGAGDGPGAAPSAAVRAVVDALERLDAGGEPVGWVLPLAWRADGSGFLAGRWRFRRGRLTLVPGDSPIGLRLPLDAVDAAEDAPGKEPLRDPWEPAAPLPQRGIPAAAPAPSVPCAVIPERIGTALCVEARPEGLCVFLPPLPTLEAWVALLSVLERAAAACGRAIVLEGYGPPPDPRLKRLSVTPDPGVIEVNVHPAASWGELCDIVELLYAIARRCGLSTEKFMVDGRHTGTGGGNHLTLGGSAPEHSPLLRRPRLLTSMIRFWQTHPSLSYLFSGTFIGPTSQSPRVDEARPDGLYELEIALSEVENATHRPPWLVDRALRHHLTDLTGNTHRSEFCIDKLYSPDSASGRLGLLELRGFEMPPHAQMSLLQMLLVRALVATFWAHPIRRTLVRWGTALYDRFMLPHFVWADFLEVLQFLDDHGYTFEAEWFRAFFEFRFPGYGEVALGPVDLELRGAIEPWHVLGEEVTAGGTARYVDSAVERLQVRVSGLHADRHVLLCNGERVPLEPTGRSDESVAGVRFQAWQPPSSLNPTIPVQVPLVFDVLDAWNGRSLGGCRYFVQHPGGKNPEQPPINDVEAESRRMARFWSFGHTPGPITHVPGAWVRRSVDALPPRDGVHVPPEPARDPEAPVTLDLRRHRGALRP